MNIKRLNLVVLFLVLVLLSSCSTVEIRSVAKPQSGIQLDFEKYQLANGLTVILHQDTSDPLVHVDVTYHVGSAREYPGQSGFAHFFEHMMFQGSKHVPDEAHFKIVTESGGELNGTTNNDRTNYFQTVPANQLERILWLESDRMGFLLEAVTQEKFEVQRDTVKNERAQRVDNQPYGLRSETVSQALYPVSHPYSWPVIGFIEDLERVGVQDLQQFFLRWYGPNNAVLTIGGDIDIATTKAWVEQYFGNIPTGPEVSDPSPQPVTLSETRYITLEDSVHLPLIQKTLPTVYARHPDEAPLDVLADILGGGKTSLLYKNLVKTGEAVQAVVSHPCRELACEFQIIALSNPATTPNLSVMEDKIKATLAEFEQRGVLADDLLRTKSNIEAATVFGLQSVAGKVSLLAANETFHNQPDLVAEDLARYNAVTAEDVMRVYQQYVKDKASVVLSIVPDGQLALAAKEDTFALPPRLIENRDIQPAPLRTMTSEFDRNIIPKSGPPPVIITPTFWQSQLANGIEVFGITSNETPTVNMSLAFEGGVLLDPIEKAGLASFTAALMNESTANFKNEEIANELAKLGSAISVAANGRYTLVNVSSLSHNIEQTMALVEEKLLRPAFNEEEFERLRTRIIQSKSQQLKNPSVLANQARDTLLFGSENRVSLPDTGTLSTLQAISLDDVKQFYTQFFTSAMANVVVVGTLSERETLALLDFLRQLPATPYSIPSYQPFPEYSEQVIHLVDKPDSVQSVVKLIRREIPFDATGDYFYSRLMNFPLGGAFNSRINLNLREEKSITYGASSSFIGGKSLGWFEASTDVQQASTTLAITEILKELRRYKDTGITADELAFMRSAYTQSDALDYETPSSKAGFLRRLAAFGLSPDFRQKQLAIIETITEQEIDAIAKQRLQPDELQIIVVGDAEKIAPQLNSLGIPVNTMTLAQ